MSHAPPPPAGEAASAPSDAPLDPTLDWYAIISAGTANAKAAVKVGPQSSVNELNTAYRRRAKELHPDKNPDKSAVAQFHLLKRVYDALKDEKQRAVYDARIAAAAARTIKDAALDASLSTMKRDLLRREAEALTAKMQAASAKAAYARNGPPKSAEEISRAANAELLRSFEKEKSTAATATEEVERPTKVRRRVEQDNGVHAGYADEERKEAPSAASSYSSNATSSVVDEKLRTISLRWSRHSTSTPTLSIPPSSSQLTSLLSKYGTIEHTFLRTEKRRALIVFTDVNAVSKCTNTNIKWPDGVDVRRLDKTEGEKTEKTADEKEGVMHQSHSATASSVPPSITTRPTPSSSSSAFTASHIDLTSSPSLPLASSSTNLTPDEYEAATLKRMAEFAEKKRLKRLQQQRAEAQATPSATTSNGEVPMQMNA